MHPAIRRIPAILSGMLLAAHFLRSGDLPLVVLSVLFPALLWVRRPWALRAVQGALVTAAGIWTWTAIEAARMRIAEGRPGCGWPASWAPWRCWRWPRPG